MDLTAVKGIKITAKDRARQWEGGLCMYCRDSRHFEAACQRKLKVVLDQV
jgi:hypothetical protein